MARGTAGWSAGVRTVLTECCGQRNSYGGFVLDLSRVDLEEIATALADQTDDEHRYLINPQTGEIVFWTADTGIDGQTPVDLDELNLICIDPLPSHSGIRTWPTSPTGSLMNRPSDDSSGPSAARARSAASKEYELHEEYPELLPAWYAFRDSRARHRAVDWLEDNSLIDHDTATRYRNKHPEPDVPSNTP